MSEELERLCGKIALTEGEKVGLVISEGEIAEGRMKGERCLVGRIGGERRVNKEAFRTVLSRIWRLAGSVVFKEVQDNIWLFEFEEVDDKRRVFEGRPWFFDRQILVIQEFDGSIPVSQMEFSFSPFWVQVHEMPLVCMNKTVGIKIGESMGVVEDVDVAGDGAGWGRCLRIRVIINLHKPLERGRALQLGGKSYWVVFKYEKLPMLCFDCGRILHDKQGCPVKSVHRRNNDRNVKKWGVWLRADDSRRTGGGDRGGGVQHSTTRDSEGGSTFKGGENKASPHNHGNPCRCSNAHEDVSSQGSDSFHMESARSGGGNSEVGTQGNEAQFTVPFMEDAGGNNCMVPDAALGVDVHCVPNIIEKKELRGEKPSGGEFCIGPSVLENMEKRPTSAEVGNKNMLGGAEGDSADVGVQRDRIDMEIVPKQGEEESKKNLKQWKRMARGSKEDLGSFSHSFSGGHKRKFSSQEEGLTEQGLMDKKCKGALMEGEKEIKTAAAAMRPRRFK